MLKDELAKAKQAPKGALAYGAQTHLKANIRRK